MSMQTLESIIKSEIRHTNYFNGRLLTASALQNEQKANRLQRQQLGQAIGDGIVDGLEVTLVSTFPPVVNVTDGLAVNQEGSAFKLENPVELQIDLVKSEISAANDVFEACKPQEKPLIKEGFSVLVAAPDYQYDGFTSQFSLIDDMPSGCGLKDIVEGVKFRTVAINLADRQLITEGLQKTLNELLESRSTAAYSLAQNITARACLGSGTALNWPVEFETSSSKNPPPANNLIDRLRQIKLLQPCEVPLALLYQNGSDLVIVDMWAVRRRIYLGGQFEMPVDISPGEAAAGEAAWLQFQTQMAALENDGRSITPANLSTYFRFLPPAGLLSRTPSGVAYSPHLLPLAHLGTLLTLSFRLPPLNLEATPSPVINYFDVRQAGGQADLIFFAGDQLPVLLDHGEFAGLLERLDSHEELLESLIGEIGEGFVRVPYLVGNILRWAASSLTTSDLNVGRIIDTHAETVNLAQDNEARGRVIVSQQIQGGTTAPRGSLVNLIVTTEPDEERQLSIAGSQRLFNIIQAELDQYSRLHGLDTVFEAMDEGDAFIQLNDGDTDIVLSDRQRRPNEPNEQIELDDLTIRTGVALFGSGQFSRIVTGLTPSQIAVGLGAKAPTWGDVFGAEENSKSNSVDLRRGSRNISLGSDQPGFGTVSRDPAGFFEDRFRTEANEISFLGEARELKLDAANAKLDVSRILFRNDTHALEVINSTLFSRSRNHLAISVRDPDKVVTGNPASRNELENYTVVDELLWKKASGFEIPPGLLGFTTYESKLHELLQKIGLSIIPVTVVLKGGFGGLLDQRVDVFPTDDSIRSGNYPLTRPNYVYFRQNLAEEKPIFANWLNSLVSRYG